MRTMALICEYGHGECNGCGLCGAEQEPCPHCGSDSYEYIVWYAANRSEVAYCSDCEENGYLVKEWSV